MRLIVACSCFVVFLLYLITEKLYLSSITQEIPIRICITGTRGKSSLVRLVHKALNENGIRTLGKTTGTRPSLLLPDGSEREISRRGPPSILEQRKILRKAHRHNVEAYVIETMSIRPEYRIVEAKKILKPNLIGVARITRDHVAEMGNTKKKISETIAAGIPDGAEVVIGDRDFLQYAARSLEDTKIIEANGPAGDDRMIKNVLTKLDYWEFAENVRLALSIVEKTGLNRKEAADGMAETRPDPGSLRAWSIPCRDVSGENIKAVNAFAANDPESTEIALKKTMERLSSKGGGITGLLNLREDRGMRTLQWKKALSRDLLSYFDRVYVLGANAEKFQGFFQEKFVLVEAVRFTNSVKLTNKICHGVEGGGIVFGFGNIGVAGRRLVRYWSEIGELL
ncbi:poly-gamma-glutamate synthase PgsB [Candidatus Bipolaricaulota bacterium]|nr:poly-gamma-glutamate synthase PgsB [Candidatus Bipolaricaulota bacterium]